MKQEDCKDSPLESVVQGRKDAPTIESDVQGTPPSVVDFLCKPYRKLAAIKRQQAKKSWNPFVRVWFNGFADGLEAAADLVARMCEHAEKRRSTSREDE